MVRHHGETKFFGSAVARKTIIVGERRLEQLEATGGAQGDQGSTSLFSHPPRSVGQMRGELRHCLDRSKPPQCAGGLGSQRPAV